MTTAKAKDDWDGRTFCNQCGRPSEGMPSKCDQCGNVEFSLKENPTYVGWLRKNERLF